MSNTDINMIYKGRSVLVVKVNGGGGGRGIPINRVSSAVRVFPGSFIDRLKKEITYEIDVPS